MKAHSARPVSDGAVIETASRDQDEVLVAEMDKKFIREVRDTWQFYRDRRPETYENMVELLP